MDVQKIREQQKLDAIVLFSTEEILAAAGIYAPKSCLITEEKGMLLLCPEGQETGDGLQIQEYAEFGFDHVENARENLWKLVKRNLEGKKRIGYNRYSCPLALSGMEGNEYRDITREIANAMLCKNTLFFEKYKAVKQRNILAYDTIREKIRSGCTEQALYNAVKETYVSNTEGQVLYTGDFLSGKRACEIAGPATDKVIMPGDTIIVDALCSFDGVYCDTTRSYFCGEPTKEQEKAYELLCALQQETKKRLRPGTIAGDIYRYVDQRLREEGYAGLPHHAGHGLGYSWYEAPYFIAECDTVLQEDMLVAIEPGIYLAEQFGLRLENNYRVTKDGGVDVFDYTQKIEEFVIA